MNHNTIHSTKGTTMKRILITAAATIPLFLAPVAQAMPAMCGSHAEYGDASTGMQKDAPYVTACGGDSGPDAAGNNATAPSVDTTAS